LQYTENGKTKLYAVPVLIKNYVTALGKPVNRGMIHSLWVIRMIIMWYVKMKSNWLRCWMWMWTSSVITLGLGNQAD